MDGSALFAMGPETWSRGLNGIMDGRVNGKVNRLLNDGLHGALHKLVKILN